MKRFLFTSLMLFLFVYCDAINITLGDMQQIFTAANWQSANQILSKKYWYFQEKKEVENSKCHEVWYNWGYDNVYHSDVAPAWFKAYVDNYGNGKITRLQYDVFDIGYYSTMMASLTKYGYRQAEDADPSDANTIISIYRNDKYILRVYLMRATNYDEYEGYLTRYIFVLDQIGGVHDDLNGRKMSYYDNGKMQYDFTLKNGVVVGDYVKYHENGKVQVCIKQQPNQWLVEDYRADGSLSYKITVPVSKNERIKRGEQYHIIGQGIMKGDTYEHKGDIEFNMFAYDLFLDYGTILILPMTTDSACRRYEKIDYEYDDGKNLISKTITNFDNGNQEYSIYDAKNRLIEKGQKRDDKLYGEVLEKEYTEDGNLYRERTTTYVDGEKEGECVTTTYLSNGIKVKEVDNYRNGKYDGYCYQESYINGERQIDKYGTYHNGKLNGKSLMITGDSVIYTIYQEGEIVHIRYFRDDMMHFRSPQYILTDTTKLTLISDACLINGKVLKMESYYPGYFSDTIKMIKGKHAGELQWTFDGEKGVHIIYSDFEVEYEDPTYKSYYLEVHVDPDTHKNNGLTIYKDSLGNYIHVKNYKNGLNDGWSKYYNVSYCDGEFQSLFNNGIWLKSTYKPIGENLVEIQKISSSQVCVLTYSNANKIARKDYYIVNSKTIEGFNSEIWVNIFNLNDTYKTGEFYIYNEDGKIISYREKDSNFIVDNDYDQQVSVFTHKAMAVPEKYYKLNTQEFFSGTFKHKLGATTEIVKVKNGYRDGETKVVDNKTGKTIKKIKYSKGIAK